MMLALLRAVGLIGVAGCAALLLALLLSPKGFERSAIGFAKARIETEMRARVEGLEDSRAAEGLRRLSDRLGLQQDGLAAGLASDLPEIVAAVVERACGCASTREARTAERAEGLRAAMEARIAGLGATRGRLADIIAGRYAEIVASLRAEIVIFLGTNLAAFAAIFAATFVPRERRGLVVMPAALLVLSVGIAGGIYLMGTNWFHAIVFQDYVGFGYAVWLLVVFALLADIVLNRGRVCLRIASSLPVPVPPFC